jgi:hypothetical protein
LIRYLSVNHFSRILFLFEPGMLDFARHYRPS